MQAAELLGGLDGAGPIGFRGHIVPDEGRSRPELDSQRLALIIQHVADHHLRTLRYQQAGLCSALAARPAAHEHHWGANVILRFDPKTEKFESFPLPDSYASVRQLAGRKGDKRAATFTASPNRLSP